MPDLAEWDRGQWQSSTAALQGSPFKDVDFAHRFAINIGPIRHIVSVLVSATLLGINAFTVVRYMLNRIQGSKSFFVKIAIVQRVTINIAVVEPYTVAILSRLNCGVCGLFLLTTTIARLHFLF